MHQVMQASWMYLTPESKSDLRLDKNMDDDRRHSVSRAVEDQGSKRRTCHHSFDHPDTILRDRNKVGLRRADLHHTPSKLVPKLQSATTWKARHYSGKPQLGIAGRVDDVIGG